MKPIPNNYRKKSFRDVLNIKVDTFYIAFTSTLITPDITKTDVIVVFCSLFGIK